NHEGTWTRARAHAIRSCTRDLIGGSSFLWRRKHNVLHRTYTNISALDPDPEGGGLMLRLAPWQRRHAHHRFQHLYVWLLYGLFPLKWWFVDDIRELITGRIGGRQFPPARGLPLLGAGVGKSLFVFWAFVPPALSGAGQDRRGDLPGARLALPLRADFAQRPRRELALVARYGITPACLMGKSKW